MVSTRKRDYATISKDVQPRKRRSANLSCQEQAPKDPQLTLLGLPGEIRNRIYAYALSEPKDLFFREMSLFVPKRKRVVIKGLKLCAWSEATKDGKEPELREANQLQYVNKQLRQETKGFGLKLNDITFGKNKDYCLLDCLRFLEGLSEYWWKHLGTIIVHGEGAPCIRDHNMFHPRHPENQPQNMCIRDRIIEICSANPQLTVKWFCESWVVDVSFCRTAHTGNLLRGIFRDAYSHPLTKAIGIPPVLHQYRVEMERVRNGRCVQFFINAPNFEVFPWRQNIYDNSFTKRLEASMLVCAGHFTVRDADIQVWKDRLVDWIRNGI